VHIRVGAEIAERLIGFVATPSRRFRVYEPNLQRPDSGNEEGKEGGVSLQIAHRKDVRTVYM